MTGTQVAIELADGTILEGNLNTVALAFLMHEYAPVAFAGQSLGLEELAALARQSIDDGTAGKVAEQSIDDLAPELRTPGDFAHLTK